MSAKWATLGVSTGSTAEAVDADGPAPFPAVPSVLAIER